MELIALLRGVMPTGKNKIPKMSYLVTILEEIGFQKVRSHIQSGNLIFQTSRSQKETAALIQQTIKAKIGADLSVIIKTVEDCQNAISNNPFNDSYDSTRVHLVFTNDSWEEEAQAKIEGTDFGQEELVVGSDCFYLYLPKGAPKKKLNTNFLEKNLGITATMRKIAVIDKLLKK
ncbi:DUF1697 domain-containing protein [Streptococcus pacificus]|uniref:DUF1697 domain-containing protein n=1 Tax=Streptococcus pacificus TaxID=2740577 RepID=A0ABS0ZHR2_9STRE|nr:DUF1697 domain-containing protein [Streptococcus pacificus]MBJ8325539.1 DUF1697 domain-containing protein [Streptococcus pacificus]